MYWRDICDLAAETITLDALRKPQKSLIRREIFCNKKSVGRSEFYQAHAQGYKPEIIIEVRTEEYQNDEYLFFDDVQYRIIRAYSKNGETTELTCIRMVVSNVQQI